MTPETRKRAAEKLQANPLLSECFDKAISNCFTAWQAEPSKEDRDFLWFRMKAIQSVRSEINAAVKSALGDKQQSNTDA